MRTACREKLPDELGECEVGDIIVGAFDKSNLEVLRKTREYDDVYSYTCKYINGPFKGEETVIMSYYNYRRI